LIFLWAEIASDFRGIGGGVWIDAGFAWRLSICEIAKAISRRGFCRLRL
jgi:hypothetical protein